MRSDTCSYSRKPHADICSAPHTLAQDTTTIFPPTDCNMPAAFVNHSAGYAGVSITALADQPSRCAAGANTGPPAALQPELLTPTIMHLASLQASFSLPAFTFLSLFTTPAFTDPRIHHSGYFMHPLPSPPFGPSLHPCLGSYPTIPGI